MPRLILDIQSFSVADSERLFEMGFTAADLISLYHFETPVIVSSENRPDSE